LEAWLEALGSEWRVDDLDLRAELALMSAADVATVMDLDEREAAELRAVLAPFAAR